MILRPLTTIPAGFLTTAAAPVIRPRHPALALWLLVLAAVNLSLQASENAHWPTMLSVSQAYAQADAETCRSIGMAVRAA